MKYEIIELINKSSKEFFDYNYFYKKLKLDTSSLQKEFIKSINEIIEENILIPYFENNNEILIKRQACLEGKLELKDRGYGFVVTEFEDIFIANKDLNNAFHEDLVLVYPFKNKKGGNREGVILKILDRPIKTLIGTIRKEKKKFYFVDDNPKHKFYVKLTTKKLKEDVKVVLKITKYHFDYVEAFVYKELGNFNEIGIDVLSVIYEFGIDPYFKKDLLDYVEYINYNNDKQREDFTNLNTFTIDGKDAKDLDDAISISLLDNNNYYLGVHIADVSFYVRENTILDLEAYNRGTSIYLLDRVIPMLPERLSNDLCSLNPHENKYTISLFMEIDKKGNVLSYSVHEAIINSKHRLNYDEVNDIINNKLIKYEDIIKDLFLMKELKDILKEKRNKRGALDFLSNESYFILEDGKIKDIKYKERLESNDIIEEFMLVANETIAKMFYDFNLPIINRIHENPNEERLLKVFNIIKNLGFDIKTNYTTLKPYVVQKVLNTIKGSKQELTLNNLLLRTMAKARYNPSHLGHFGLALDYYLHFTSPIRRYPDLMVHRLIREFFFKKDVSMNNINKYENLLNDISYNTSLSERKAIDLERAVEDLKKTEYMMNYINQEFDGVVSGITKFGVFVTLENTCEGLIRFENLDGDYYEYNEDLLILVSKTGKVIKYGDLLKIKVIDANKQRRTIDFKLIKFLG